MNVNFTQQVNSLITPGASSKVPPITLPPISSLYQQGFVPDQFQCASSQWLRDVQEDHQEAVLEALKTKNINFHERDNNGWNAISIAAAQGNTEMLDLLLNQSNIDYNNIDFNNQTPLLIAAQRGNLGVVQQLLKQPFIDLSCNLKDNWGHTPIVIAMMERHFNIVRTLEKHQLRNQLPTPFAFAEYLTEPEGIGAKTNFLQPDVRLHQAAYLGDQKEVDKLLGDTTLCDTAVDAPRYYAMTSLACAASKGHVDIIRRLLKDPRVGLNTLCTSLGKTPLQYAAKHGQAEAAIELLQQPGINFNNTDQEGNTALHLAAQNGCLSQPIANFFRQNASKEVADGSTRIISALLEKDGLRVNQRNKKGRTALAETVINGNETHFDFLINHPKIKANIPDKNGLTPLHHSVLEKQYSIFNKLLNHTGLDVNRPDQYGRTALHYAVMLGDSKMVIELLQKADRQSVRPDYAGYTPFMLVQELPVPTITALVVKLTMLKAFEKFHKKIEPEQTPICTSSVDNNKQLKINV